MPEVVVDTSVVQYLHQLGKLEILRSLYSRVSLPSAVIAELAEGRRRGVDLPDAAALDWVDVASIQVAFELLPGDELGEGELEIITLALRSSDVLAILDDKLARDFARSRGIRFTGTLGVLLKAKAAGLLSVLAPVLDSLEGLGFRMDANTRAEVLRLAGESDDQTSSTSNESSVTDTP